MLLWRTLCGFTTLATPNFQWSGLSDQRALHLIKNCLQVWKWCPYEGRGVVSKLFCANKVRNGPTSANQDHQQRQTPCAQCPMLKPTHLPLSHHLPQNLFLKHITPTIAIYSTTVNTGPSLSGHCKQTLIDSTNLQSEVYSYTITTVVDWMLMSAPWSTRYLTVSTWPP